MSVSVQVSERNEWQVLTLVGRVDAFADRRIVASLKLASQRPRAWVVVDLSRCDFMSLFTLKSLLSWNQELQKTGGRLVLMAPTDNVHRQLEVFMGRSLEVVKTWEQLETQVFHERRKLLLEGPSPRAAWLKAKAGNLRDLLQD